VSQEQQEQQDLARRLAERMSPYFLQPRLSDGPAVTVHDEKAFKVMLSMMFLEVIKLERERKAHN
jgi:hypothetical protein